MKKIIILLVLLIILSGCGQEKIKQSSGSTVIIDKTISKDFIFKKNQECLKYKDGLEKKLNSKESPFGKTSLEQIFYSPKINSCLYIEYGDEGGFGYYSRRLLDIRDDGYSSNPLEACIVVKRLSGECDEFDRKLKTYK